MLNKTFLLRASKLTNFKKTVSAAAFGALAIFTPITAEALPQGGTPTNATIASAGNTMTINQSADKAIINWNSFDIGANETVNFVQSNANSVILNRVTGGSASEILGAMTANGNVFLVNPNGILFGANASVDVAGLVATTLNITDDDFNKGNYSFSQGELLSYVINKGTIKTGNNGFIYLVAPRVDNQAGAKLVVGKRGSIGLASGTSATLSLGSNLVSFEVSGTIGALIGADGTDSVGVNNAGTVKVNETGSDVGTKNATGVNTDNGGYVFLSADVTRSVLANAVNNTGIISANSLAEITGSASSYSVGDSLSGEVEIVAKGGDFKNTGTISANAAYNSKTTTTGLSQTTTNSANAGTISILADYDVVQNGRISADSDRSSTESLAGTTGGSVSISSGNSTSWGSIYSDETAADALITAKELTLSANATANMGDNIENDSSIGKFTPTVSNGDDVLSVNALKTSVSTLTVTTHSSSRVNGNVANASGNIAIANSGVGNLNITVNTNGDKGDSDLATVQISTKNTDANKDSALTGTVNAFSATLSSEGDLTLSSGTSLSVLAAETTQTGSISVDNASDSLILGNLVAREKAGQALVGSNGDIIVYVTDGDTSKSIKSTQDITIKNSGSIGVQGSIIAGDYLSLASADGAIVNFTSGSEAATTGTLLADNIVLSGKGVGQLGNALNTMTGTLITITSNGTTSVGESSISGVHIQESNRLYIGDVVSNGDVNLLTNSGNAWVRGNISATGQNVRLEATHGNVTADAGKTISGESGEFIGESVGSALRALETNVGELKVRSTDSTRGIINIKNSIALSGISVVTSGGSATISAANSLAMDFNGSILSLTNGTDVTKFDFENTQGGLVLNGIGAATTANVSLTANGAITQQGTGTLNANIATLVSNGAIGANGNALNTQVAELNLTANGGAIYVKNAETVSNLSLNATSSGSGSGIDIAGGVMTIGSISAGTGNVKLVSSGTISNGTISGVDISLNANSGISGLNTKSNGAFSAIAGGAINISNTGSINLTEISTSSGDITFTNSGSVKLGVLKTRIDGTINFVAKGDVIDGNADTLNITTGTLNVNANSFGKSTDVIETSIASVNATISAGEFAISENDTIAIGNITATGNVSVEATGNIDLGIITAAKQVVTLKTTGDIADARASAETGTPNITAKQLIIEANAVGEIGTSVTILNSNVQTGDFVLTNDGAILIDADSLNSGANLSFVATDISIFDNGGTTTTIASNKDLTLKATAGNIVFLNQSDTITFTGTGKVNFSATSATGSAGSSGLTGAIIVGNITTQGGSITLAANSHISIGKLDTSNSGALSSAGDITVISTNGYILDNNGAVENLVGKNVTISGASMTKLDLENQKALASTNASTLNERLNKLKEELSDQNEDVATFTALVEQYEIAYQAAVAAYNSAASDAESKANTADALEKTFQSLQLALDVANTALAISKIPAAAAQAIPLTGDGGAEAVIAAIEAGMSGMSTALTAADFASSAASSAAEEAANALVLATATLERNDASLADNTLLLNTHKVHVATTEDRIEKTEYMYASSVQIEAMAKLANETQNAIGTLTQALGVRAEKLDATNIVSNANDALAGTASIYLNSNASLGLGDVSADGDDSVVYVTATNNIDVKGTVSAETLVVLDAENITGTANGIIEAESLAAIASDKIGSDTQNLNTEVETLAAQGGNGVYISNAADSALTISEIVVKTQMRDMTLSGVSATEMNSTVSVMETNGSIVVDKSVSAGNQVTLNAEEDVVLNATVSSTGTVNIVAENGTINGSVAGDLQYHVDAGIFNAQANIGIGTEEIPLRTNVREFGGELSGNGDIYLENTGVLTATAAVKTGEIHLTNTSGNITVKSATTESGDIFIVATTNGNIITGTLSAGTNREDDIYLEALNGSVQGDNAVDTFISAHKLTVVAAGGIGNDSSLDTKVDIINATTIIGNIDIAQLGGNLFLERVATRGGDIGVAISGSGNKGVFSVKEVTATEDVTLTAVGGIYDATENETAAIIRGDSVSLSAEGDIGEETNRIEIEANKLSVYATRALGQVTPGSVYITDMTGGLEITGVDTKGSGVVDIVTSGDMLASESFDCYGDLHLVSSNGSFSSTTTINAVAGINIDVGKSISISGNYFYGADGITLNAGTDVSIAGGGIYTENVIKVFAGNNISTSDKGVIFTRMGGAGIELIAKHDIILNAYMSAASTGGEAHSLWAVNGSIIISAGNDLKMENANSFVKAKGDVNISAKHDILFTGSVSSTENNIFIDGGNDITARSSISAVKGIIDIATKGEILTEQEINASGNIEIKSLLETISLGGSLTSDDGNATIIAKKAVSVSDIVADNVLITSEAGSVAITGEIAAQETLNVTAGTNIEVRGALEAPGDIILSARTGDVLIEDSVTTTNSGDIEIDAGNDIIINSAGALDSVGAVDVFAKKAVSVSNIVADNILITSEAESVAINGEIVAQEMINVTAGTDIEVRGELAAPDDIILSARIGDVLIGDKVTTTDGNVEIIAGTNIAQNAAITANAAVYLESKNGGISSSLSQSSRITAKDLIVKVANGNIDNSIIYTDIDTLEVTVTGTDTESFIKISEKDDLVLKNISTATLAGFDLILEGGSVSSLLGTIIKSSFVRIIDNGLRIMDLSGTPIATTNVTLNTDVEKLWIKVNGDIKINELNDISISVRSAITVPSESATGTVKIIAEGDILVDNVVALTEVELISNNGNILKSQDGQVFPFNVVSTNVKLSAAGDIGASDRKFVIVSPEIVEDQQEPIEMTFTSENLYLDGKGTLKNVTATVEKTAVIDVGDVIEQGTISAETLTINSVNGVGTVSAINTSVDVLNIESLSENGDVNIAQSGDVEIGSIVVGGETAGEGRINVVVSATDEEDGSIKLGSISTQGNVSLSTENGNVSNAGTSELNIVAANATISAEMGIGTKAAPLNTSIETLSAETTTGGVFINNGEKTLTLNEISAGTEGDIIIAQTGVGDLIVSKNLTVAQGNNITLSSDENIVQNANITVSGNGNVSVTAGDSISLENNAAGTADAGTITYKAKNALRFVTGTLIASTDKSAPGTVNVVGENIVAGTLGGSLNAAYVNVNTTDSLPSNSLLEDLIVDNGEQTNVKANGRVSGGLYSLDTTFIHPDLKTADEDLGWTLLFSAGGYNSLFIDKSVYPKGFEKDNSESGKLIFNK